MDILKDLYNFDYDCFLLVLKYVQTIKNNKLVIEDLKKHITLRKCIELNEIYLTKQEIRIDMMYAMDRDYEANDEEQDFIFYKKEQKERINNCVINNDITFDEDDFVELYTIKDIL